MIRTIPECRCLNCGHVMNRIGEISPGDDGTTIKPGESVLCIRCGAVMACADDYTLRGFTDAEQDALLADTEHMAELAKYVQRIHLMRHSQG